MINCPQQRCIVHLIRDMNEDLIQDPFDNELKKVTEEFSILMREIINTIDRFESKK